jgi:type II secretory pathway component HofQ
MRYVVSVTFVITLLFGCMAPKVERDVEPIVVEVYTTPSLLSQRDSEEIVEVPLLIGAEEALQEGKPVGAENDFVLPFRTSETGKEGRDKAQHISIRCQNADLVDVLDRIAEISGLNLVLHPGISGTVTVRLENIPWDQALDSILKANNLGFVIEGNVLRIAPASVFQQERTQRLRPD